MKWRNGSQRGGGSAPAGAGAGAGGGAGGVPYQCSRHKTPAECVRLSTECRQWKMSKTYKERMEDIWVVDRAHNEEILAKDALIHERGHMAYTNCEVEHFVPSKRSQGATIGQGNYGTVPLAKHLSTGMYCRIKVMAKKKIIDDRQESNVINEKRHLLHFKSPFIVTLLGHTKSDDHLFLILENQNIGDMFQLMTYKVTGRRMKPSQLTFYGAQVLAGLEFIHSKSIMYRDLKPENIMMDSLGYVKIGDFGFAKRVSSDGKLRTQLGTTEFMAPEIFSSRGYTYSVDWWAFGVLLFEFCVGRTPFDPEGTRDHTIMVSNIQNFNYAVPKKDIEGKRLRLSKDIFNLIESILQPPNRRISAKDIKNHSFFKYVNWDALKQRSVVAPYQFPFKKPKFTPGAWIEYSVKNEKKGQIDKRFENF